VKLAPQVFVSHTRPEPENIGPVALDLFWKPRGGMWTSTLDDEGGDWIRWLNDQDYSLEDPRWGGKLWLLHPTDVNVCVVATPEDYNALADRFPYPDNPLRNQGLKSMEKIVHWQALAEEYDALHVPTPRTYRFALSYGTNFEEYYAAGLFFDTCDAESTCWFRWCFEGEPVELDPHTPYLAAL
jgi:hypothetical protein